mgnify:CR=1 FL=1
MKVEEKETSEQIDIIKLNSDIEEIVIYGDTLRDEIDKIIEDLER